ncbi:MAG: pyrophosphate--fructose-6-phosphate 1-phosphotransferase [Puniceicoccales bacterium]|nr:pyrophosphate--fructose-6-phosphate 1-phosphotransferase [Puniceicoccales bacterium]
MGIRRVGILTAGGIAPCLSASIAYLIEAYTQQASNVEILFYRYGYGGLLRGDFFLIDGEMRKNWQNLLPFGGSAVGNSRIKLSNRDDCEKRGFIRTGQDPQVVAAERLRTDAIDVLHTIGGDDTNSVAAQLAAHLDRNGYGLAVIGLPKTIDNDVFPISQTLGADTAAGEGAKFFANIANECTTCPGMLIVHEVMGRNCGWLTYATARAYLAMLAGRKFLPSIGLRRERWGIHGIYIPEMPINFDDEVGRLQRIMADVGNVNLFVSEGAGVASILREMEESGRTIPRDAFGHIKLDQLNAGNWIGDRLGSAIGAQKVLVQKSGYFARSAAPNEFDLQLIRETAHLAVQCALQKKSGVIGKDEALGGQMTLINFARIRGGKPFDYKNSDLPGMLANLGQQIC